MHSSKKNTVEQIRPFLRAMERSIEQARQERTDLPRSKEQAHQPDPEPRQRVEPHHEERDNKDADGRIDPTRMKARRKIA